ncbi:hypothetical protein P12x_005922 [Tundrisphaera lichenicola]|uniref:hypothetical protein n=1 Tax=Tundrisphaera lichenicola TaxID=2029860 RepID=UPI003EBD32FD
MTQPLKNSWRLCAVLATLILIGQPASADPIDSVADLGVVTKVSPYNVVGYPLYIDSAGMISSQPPPVSVAYSLILKAESSSAPTLSYIRDGSGTETRIPLMVSFPELLAQGVNNSGEVVGFGSYGAFRRPFLFQYDKDNLSTSSSRTVRIPLPLQLAPTSAIATGADVNPTTGGAALAINNSGSIVGIIDSDSLHHAFVSDGLKSVDLNELIGPGSGLVLNSAVSINDLGQIVGYATDASGTTHEYRLDPIPTPAPEPSPLVLSAMVALALGLRATCAKANRTTTT